MIDVDVFKDLSASPESLPWKQTVSNGFRWCQHIIQFTVWVTPRS